MKKNELIKKIKEIETLSNDEKTALIELLSSQKRYGLVWEDKPEAMEEELRHKLPILKEVVDKRIIADSTQAQTEENDNNLFTGQENEKATTKAPNHILIEGDNLHALSVLNYTHAGKVDVIYIDPPYNTGNKDDFIYNDHYVDKEDAFRHSKWLSFMYRRLKLAKFLLKEDGVIFCSIGDDEISQLTLLFNEVFSENNKLGVIARVAKTAGDKGSYFAPSKDYVIAYTKNKLILPDFKDGVDDSLFKKVETEGTRKGEKYRDDVAFYQSSLDTRPNQRYYIRCPDNTFVIPPGISKPEVVKDGAKANPINGDGVWRWANETYFDNEKRRLLIFKQTKKSPLIDENGNRAKWNIYTKSYLNDRSEKGSSPRDYLDQFINRKGADLIKQYDIDFSYSKPYELIQHLIKITNKEKNITVLDFFAGSGTTLHSVMSLNEQDNGTRTCIITTNNENNICEEVTYPRCERLINKYVNKKGQKMPSYPNNNLRYYKTEFVDSAKTLKNRTKVMELAKDMLCIKDDCYNEITDLPLLTDTNFTSSKIKLFENENIYLMIIYDEQEIDNAIEIIKTLDKKVNVYIFSAGQYPFTDDFEEVLDKVELCALPEAIYKAYKSILPKKKAEVLIETEIEEIEPKENESNDFDELEGN